MIKHFFSRWLIFIFFILSLLTACGGGSDEPSNLLGSTFRPEVPTSPTPTTDESASFQFKVIDLKNNQQLIPSGGRTTIKRTALYANASRVGEIAPLIPLNISLHPPGAAKLEDAPKFTDKDGNLIFTVSHPGSENIIVNISGRVSGRDIVQQGFDIPLYFGGTATADVIQSISTADGFTPAIIKVVARDWKGAAIRGLPVELAFPPNSSATIAVSDTAVPEGYHDFMPATVIAPTDDSGLFIGINNNVPETTKVTPIVGGLTIGTYSLDFRTGTVATGETIKPEFIVKSDNVLADGVAAAKVIVLARNSDTKSPIPNVPIRIYSDSLTAQLRIGGEVQTFSITGNTGALGYIELTITNTVEEKVTLTAVTTTGSTPSSSEPQAITFTTGESPTGIKATKITLDDPIPKEVEANGTNSISLVGKVIGEISVNDTTKEEVPVADFPVSILVSGGSAKMKIANDGKTNDAGFFVVTFTDTVVEEFTARAVAGTISSELKTLKFAAVPVQTTEPGETPTIVPASVTLIASPPTQIADGTAKITLVARVRDSRNIPLTGANVEITADSDTSPILFDKTQQATDAGGSATFTATSTAVGEFTVTVQAWAVDKNDQLVGSPVRNSRSITFVSADIPVTNLNIESITDDYQDATGKASIKVKVSAKNDQGQPVKNAPIVVQLSAGEEAKAIPAKGFTGDDGTFETTITSTRAGKIGVSFTVEQTSVTTPPTTVTFVAIDSTGTGDGPPVSHIDLKVENNNQPADSQSKITLIVIPRDAQNTPLFGKEIVLFTNSPEVTLEKADGTTNELGEFRTTIISAKPQSVQVTAAIKGQIAPITTQTVTFVAPQPAASATIDFQILNDNQPADDKSESILVVTVKAANGTPVPGAAVKFLADDPNLKIGEGFTNEIGEFRTAVKHNVPGTFRIIPVVGTIPGTPKYITFAPTAGAVIPASIQLEVVGDAQKPADGQAAINLRAVVFDNQGKPLPGVDVELVSNSTNAKIATATGKTNSLGEFLTTVTDAVAETVNITPIAKDAKGTQVTGAPVALTFIAIGLEVADLSVTVIDNNQDANGDTPVIIQVIARDSGGRAVPNVPIEVQMPTGTSAVAKVDEQQKKDAQGQVVTDDTGVFKVGITSRQAGDVHVTISVKDTEIAHPPVTVTFKPSSDSTAFPSTVELIVFNSPQPADGKSKISLVVIPRDASGNPLPGKNVNLIADSDEVAIATATESKTNELGEFRTTVTTKEDMTEKLAETLVVNITPVSEGVVGEPTPVVFTPVSVPIPATLTLTADKTSVEIGSEDTNVINLTVLTRDESGSPMPNVPVRFLVSPGSEPPDITGSTIFVDGFEGKTSEESGIFQAKIRNNLPGTVKITAVVLSKTGGEPILNSNTVEVTFTAGTSTAPEVNSIELITSTPQLVSEGKAEGIVIKAIVKNKDNNLVKDVDVKFSADSGELTVTKPRTDESGIAEAKLTTLNNHNNRTITVIATASSVTGEIREDRLSVEVVGTVLTVSGEKNVTLGNTADLIIVIKDSAGKGIGEQTLTVSSLLGNALSLPGTVPTGQSTLTVTTNAIGRADIVLTATLSGQETITVKQEADQEPKALLTETFNINISDDDLRIEPKNDPPDMPIDVPLDESKKFTVFWKKAGVPQVGKQINLSTTRGTLDKNSLLTQLNGDDSFTISSNDVGPTTITATVPDGPTVQVKVEFIANQARAMTIQANPSTIGVNQVGSNTEQSEIIVVVRDMKKPVEDSSSAIEFGNLVKGVQVNFILSDVTGGYLQLPTAVTDRFGRASTIYVAGASPSASDGVTVTANVTKKAADVTKIYCAGAESAPSGLGCSTHLTVALKKVFISLGTGNSLSEPDTVIYEYPYKALVTDINGAPIPEAEVVLSIIPVAYYQGYWRLPTKDEQPQTWKRVQTAGPCLNEDFNSNGILDEGEDRNKNNRLDPGGVVTFTPGQANPIEGSTVKVKTGVDGFADFSIFYFQENATWVDVELTARTLVEGSEDNDVSSFGLRILTADISNLSSDPPGNPSPFGNSDSCDK